MHAATVLTVSSRALVEACEAIGVDTAACLAAAGLTRDDVRDPDGRIPVEKMAALWREVFARADQPDLALRAAAALPFGAYAVIDFLASSSASAGAAFERISRYFPLINGVVELPIELGDEVRLDMVDRRGPGKLPRPYAEYTLAAVVLRTRVALGADVPLVRVDFAYDAPADPGPHGRTFGCPVAFGAARTGIVVARAVWDAPVVTRGDTGLGQVLERHARMLVDQLPRVSAAVDRIRDAIRDELRGGDPSLDHVAKQLGTSRRSLQRRLADDGLTYAQVLDEIRSTMARAYLAQRELSIAEIAYLLGFSEQSSFTRAFRRWTGAAPAEFRRTRT